ncbi:sporulation related protein [Rhodobacter sp. JA431]|uniref:SPOR domain-containing protein n=1 Tax=Rhodobacter sp. JA431 TaxID=570013 RepID=UPI000BCF4AF2|nr:SPOR domain-containing protein [Rhodobacter sp. JA431]SOC19829.1 sporulation related protein [Rhodobacter sp. JA431]
MQHPDPRMGGSHDMTGGGGAPVQRWVQWAGAASSVALVIGVVIWGYKLAVRDVSGVPIIRAIEGPARVAPENPGGDLAAHVGLAVNEVAGSGVAAPGPDRVVLAPDPVELAPDDAPMAALRPLPEIAPSESEQEDVAPEAEEEVAALPVPDSARPTPELEDPPEPGIEAAVAAAMQEILQEEAEGEPPEDAPETPAADIISPDVPGLARSPRPVPRPARDLQAEAAAAARAQTGDTTVIEIDPASLPAGTRVVQLGAYDSPEIARGEWDRAMRQFEPLMAGKRRIVQEAISGGRSFWRLRVEGFANVDEARQFCAALVAEGANCIPTVIK